MRAPIAAGSYYPKDPKELLSNLELLFQTQEPKEYLNDAIGIVAPHAGYLFSGPVAARTFKAISGTQKRNFVILGVDHAGGDVIATSKEDWSTPLGPARVNLEMIKKITREHAIMDDETAVRQEHSIEIQLPFLQYLFGEFQFVPLQLPRLPFSEIQDLAEIIADKNTFFIASSDLIHYGSNYGFIPQESIYGPDEFVQKLDAELICLIQEGNSKKFFERVENSELTVCGYVPITLLMEVARILKAKKIEKIGHDTSFSLSHDVSAIVGYGGIAFR